MAIAATPFDHDLCLSFFGHCYQRGMLHFPQGARVLEVGSAEADWPAVIKTLRPDLHITCLDWRDQPRKDADVTIHGDVLNRSLFAPHTFDCIVSISAIEHVGLGAYGDPLREDGDTVAMEHCRLWVVPDGWMYFDVPYRLENVVSRKPMSYRVYTKERLKERLLQRWEIQHELPIESNHPDGPFIALTVTPA